MEALKQPSQSLKSKRDIEKMNAQMRVLSKRLVTLEQIIQRQTPHVEQLKIKVQWLTNQLKEGMSEVLTNACERIAREELTAEIVYDEPTIDQQLITALNKQTKQGK